jgi:hypothetical protein
VKAVHVRPNPSFQPTVFGGGGSRQVLARSSHIIWEVR